MQSSLPVELFFGSIEGNPPELWTQKKGIWNQVHGVAVAEVTGPCQERGDVDALWTRLPHQPVGVRAADCVPILMACVQGGQPVAAAAIHAGWRGTLARITDHFFKGLPKDLANPGDWVAWIGPSNRACCYEVSPELIEQFKSQFPELHPRLIEPRTRFLDLAAINEAELIRLGLTRIEVIPQCTFCAVDDSGKPIYFSYRRGDRASRQHFVIYF